MRLFGMHCTILADNLLGNERKAMEPERVCDTTEEHTKATLFFMRRCLHRHAARTQEISIFVLLYAMPFRVCARVKLSNDL